MFKCINLCHILHLIAAHFNTPTIPLSTCHKNGRIVSETYWSWHKNGQKKSELNWNGLDKITEKYWNSKGEEVDSLKEAKAE